MVALDDRASRCPERSTLGVNSLQQGCKSLQGLQASRTVLGLLICFFNFSSSSGNVTDPSVSTGSEYFGLWAVPQLNIVMLLFLSKSFQHTPGQTDSSRALFRIFV